MDQLEYALDEIRRKSVLSEDQFSIVESAISQHRDRMRTTFPNYDLFTTGTGQSYGLMMEKRIIASFYDLKKHEGDSSYDAEFGNQRIEIKSLKCTHGDSSQYIGQRIVNFEPGREGESFGTGSFQQVKPEVCDWFIFHVLYGNAERLFIVPSKMFSAHPGVDRKEPGKLLLSIQHRNHPSEGQANLSTILSAADFFEVSLCTGYEEGYRSAYQDTYCFASMVAIVKKRLDDVGWMLP